MKKSLDTVETNIICYLIILIVFIFLVTFFLFLIQGNDTSTSIWIRTYCRRHLRIYPYYSRYVKRIKTSLAV